MRTEVPIPTERLAQFCRQWKIVERRVFGSALRADFCPDSDLDLLRFAPDADWSLMDHVAMEGDSLRYRWAQRSVCRPGTLRYQAPLQLPMSLSRSGVA